MSRKNRYEMNYDRFEALLGCPPAELLPGRSYHYRASGFMDLIVEKLPPCEHTGAMLISMVHYFEMNGDLCQDPEIVLRVFPPGSPVDFSVSMAPSTDSRYGRVEAISFQQALPPIYLEVYPQPGKFAPKLMRDTNAFLTTWLNNLKEQGHRLIVPSRRDEVHPDEDRSF